MKAALLGANGQIATALLRQASFQSSLIFFPLNRKQCDICDPASVREHLARLKKEEGCNMVINAAAWTAVDQAETHPEDAMAVNHQGSANIAAACAALDLPLIHFSTDYVFDGRKGTPYTEDDPISPLSVYGKTKAAGDQAVQRTAPRHIILRTSWVFSAYGHNFLKTMIKLAGERDLLKIVADQTGGPTPAADIAKTVVTIAAHILHPDFREWGVYHYSGAPAVSWHGFASYIMESLKKRGQKTPDKIEAITTDQYPLPAVRPAFSVLSCEKIKDVFSVSPPDWRSGIDAAIDEILKTT